MRKPILLLLVGLFILNTASCGDIYSFEEIKDVQAYEEIWTISERRVYESDHYLEPLATFPKDISALNVLDFYCWHATFRYTSSGFQIHLSVQYNETDYNLEIKRLSEIQINAPIKFDKDNFCRPTYVAAWNWNNSYEYAICNEENYTVDYVYLQLISPENIILDSSLIPTHYNEFYYSETFAFSVYM